MFDRYKSTAALFVNNKCTNNNNYTVSHSWNSKQYDRVLKLSLDQTIYFFHVLILINSSLIPDGVTT